MLRFARSICLLLPLFLLLLPFAAASLPGFSPYIQNLSVPTFQPPLLGLEDGSGQFVPTSIFVAWQTVSIRKINPPDFSFVFDAFMYYTWRDDRVPYFGPLTMYSPQQSFSPNPELSRQAGGATLLNEVYLVRSGAPNWLATSVLSAAADRNGTWVVLERHIIGSALEDFDLRLFPFDSHVLQISIESTYLQKDFIVFLSATNEPEVLQRGM